MNSPQPSSVMNSMYVVDKLRPMVWIKKKIHSPAASTLTDVGVSLDVSTAVFFVSIFAPYDTQ
jgi:hypothetical protein